MQGKSLGDDTYFVGLSGHPPKKTAVACVELLLMTPQACIDRAVNEEGNGICVRETEEN